MFILPDGSRHEGEFENGRPKGWGVFTFANGRRYEGEWLHGQPHGHGIFTWKDGKRYVFPCLVLVLEAPWHFSMVWPPIRAAFLTADRMIDTIGRRFEGTSSLGKLEGDGKITWPGGEVYHGQFYRDKEHGIGAFVTADGSLFCGEYSDGQGNGRSVLDLSRLDQSHGQT